MCEAIKFYCKNCKELYHQQGLVEYNHCQKPECIEPNYTDYYLGYCDPCDFLKFINKTQKEKQNSVCF